MKQRSIKQAADAFEVVKAVGLTLPDVEAATKYDGSPVLKRGGSFMAGIATHPSAEPARWSSGRTWKSESCCSRMRQTPIT